MAGWHKVTAAQVEADPVGAAILEGKIPESRRDHYLQLMAKKPKKTRRLLDGLEAGLTPDERSELVQAAAEVGVEEARVETAMGGPTAYPRQWTSPVAVGGNIFVEKDTGGPLPPVQPGEIL